MKCINKNSGKGKKKTGKQRELHKSRMRKTIFLILFLIILLLIGILGILLFVKSRSLKEIQPYSKTQRFFQTTAAEHSLLADGLAENLCVGSSDTPLEGIEPAQQEQGGLFAVTKKEIPFACRLYDKTEPGRLTQLMTVLEARETLNPEDTITIEQEDMVYGQNTAASDLSPGNTVTVQQLLNAVLVSSAPDACKALSRAAGGSEEAFVTMMNTRAGELGMTNTRYVNVTGVSDENQYTSVYDTYLLLNALLEYPELTNAMGLSSYTLNYYTADGTMKQQWLDSDNYYVSGRITIPKGITVLGGKYMVSDSQSSAAILVQNTYGDVFAAVVFGAENESVLNTRICQMLEKAALF